MTLDWNRDNNPSCSLRIMAPKGLGHLAAQERFHKPEVPTLIKSGHKREIFDTSQLLKTPELQDQRGDFNETHIALINYPCRPLQGGNTPTTGESDHIPNQLSHQTINYKLQITIQRNHLYLITLQFTFQMHQLGYGPGELRRPRAHSGTTHQPVTTKLGVSHNS